jgi:hypothetical protein
MISVKAFCAVPFNCAVDLQWNWHIFPLQITTILCHITINYNFRLTFLTQSFAWDLVYRENRGLSWGNIHMASGCLFTQHLSFHSVDCVWYVMAHAQKQDFVFRRYERVHLNRRGVSSMDCWQPRCAPAVVMLDTPSSEVVKGTGYPLHSPVSPSLSVLCVTAYHHVLTGLCSWNLTGESVEIVWKGGHWPRGCSHRVLWNQ